MMESAGQEKWNWKLRTSTETIDYFWIDDHMRTTRKSIFFGCVDDESSQRSGYFLLEEKYVEIGVNNLDAQRKDRFGRNISNSLLLRSSRKDEQRTEWLRKMFVEAICDASKDPVVAILAREFYNLWKSRDASHSSGDTWSVPSKTPVIPVDSPSPDSVLPGWQYARTPESLRKFAAVALSLDTDILLLCAATNPVNRIWSNVASQNIPTAVCAMTVKQDSKYIQQSRDPASRSTHTHQESISENLIDNLGKGIGYGINIGKSILKRKYPHIILVVVILTAFALLWKSYSNKESKTDPSAVTSQNSDYPSTDIRDAQPRGGQREASQGVHP